MRAPPGLLLLLALLPCLPAAQGQPQGQVEEDSQEYYEEYEDEEPRENIKVNVPDSFRTYLQDLLTREDQGEQVNNSSILPPLNKGEEELQNKKRNSSHQHSFNINEKASKAKTLETLTKHIQKIPQTIPKPRPNIVHPYGKSDLSNLLSSLRKAPSSFKPSKQGYSSPSIITYQDKDDVNYSNTKSKSDLGSKSTEHVGHKSLESKYVAPRSSEKQIDHPEQFIANNNLTLTNKNNLKLNLPEKENLTEDTSFIDSFIQKGPNSIPIRDTTSQTRLSDNFTEETSSQTHSGLEKSNISEFQFPQKNSTTNDDYFIKSLIQKIPENTAVSESQSKQINGTYSSGIIVPYDFNKSSEINTIATDDPTKLDNFTSQSASKGEKVALDESSGRLTSTQSTVEAKEDLNSNSFLNDQTTLSQWETNKIGSKYEDSVENSANATVNDPIVHLSLQEPNSTRKSETSNFVIANDSDSNSIYKSEFPTNDDNNKTTNAYSDQNDLNNETKTKPELKSLDNSSANSEETKATSKTANNVNTTLNEINDLSQNVNSKGGISDWEINKLEVSPKNYQSNDNFTANIASVSPSKVAAIQNDVIVNVTKKNEVQYLNPNHIKTNEPEEPDQSSGIPLTTSDLPERDDNGNEHNKSATLTTPLMSLSVTGKSVTEKAADTSEHAKGQSNVKEQNTISIKDVMNDKLDISSNNDTNMKSKIQSSTELKMAAKESRMSEDFNGTKINNKTTSKEVSVNVLPTTTENSEVGNEGNELLKNNSNIFNVNNALTSTANSNTANVTISAHGKQSKSTNNGVNLHPETAAVEAFKDEIQKSISEKKFKAIDKSVPNSTVTKEAAVELTVPDYDKNELGKIGKELNNAKEIKTKTTDDLDMLQINKEEFGINGNLDISSNNANVITNNLKTVEEPLKHKVNQNMTDYFKIIDDISRNGSEKIISYTNQNISAEGKGISNNTQQTQNGDQINEKIFLYFKPQTLPHDGLNEHLNYSKKDEPNVFKTTDEESLLKFLPTTHTGNSSKDVLINENNIQDNKIGSNYSNSSHNFLIQESDKLLEGNPINERLNNSPTTSSSSVDFIFNATNKSYVDNKTIRKNSPSKEANIMFRGNNHFPQKETTLISNEQFTTPKKELPKRSSENNSDNSSANPITVREGTLFSKTDSLESNSSNFNNSEIVKLGNSSSESKTLLPELKTNSSKEDSRSVETASYSSEQSKENKIKKHPIEELLESYVKIISPSKKLKKRKRKRKGKKKSLDKLIKKFSLIEKQEKPKEDSSKSLHNLYKTNDKHETQPQKSLTFKPLNDINSFKNKQNDSWTGTEMEKVIETNLTDGSISPQGNRSDDQNTTDNQNQNRIGQSKIPENLIYFTGKEFNETIPENTQTENKNPLGNISYSMIAHESNRVSDELPTNSQNKSEIERSKVSNFTPSHTEEEIKDHTTENLEFDKLMSQAQKSNYLLSTAGESTQDQMSVNKQIVKDIFQPQKSDDLVLTNGREKQENTTGNRQIENDIMQKEIPNNMLPSNNNQKQDGTSINGQTKSDIVEPKVSNNQLNFTSNQIQDQLFGGSQTNNEIVHPQVSTNLHSSKKVEMQDHKLVKIQSERTTKLPKVSNGLQPFISDQTKDQPSVKNQTESEIDQLNMTDSLTTPTSHLTKYQASVYNQTENEIVHPQVFNYNLPYTNSYPTQNKTLSNGQREVEIFHSQGSKSLLSPNNNVTKNQTSDNKQTENEIVQTLISNTLISPKRDITQNQTSAHSQHENDIIQTLELDNNLSYPISDLTQDKIIHSSQTNNGINSPKPQVLNNFPYPNSYLSQDQTLGNSQTESDIVKPLVSDNFLSPSSDVIQDQTLRSSKKDDEIVQPQVPSSFSSPNIALTQDQILINSQPVSDIIKPLVVDNLLSPNSNITQNTKPDSTQNKNKIVQPQVSESLISHITDITQDQTPDDSQSEDEIVQPQVSDKLLSPYSDSAHDQTSMKSQTEKEIVQPQVSNSLLNLSKDLTQDETSGNDSQTEIEIVLPQVSNNLLNHTNDQTQDQTPGTSQTESEMVQTQVSNSLSSPNIDLTHDQTPVNSQTVSDITKPLVFDSLLSPNSHMTLDQTTQNTQTENKITQPQVSNSLISPSSYTTQDQTSMISQTEIVIFQQVSNSSFNPSNDLTQDQTSSDYSPTGNELVQPQVSNSLLNLSNDLTQDQTTGNDSQTEIDVVQTQVSNILSSSNIDVTQDQTSVNSQTESEIVKPLVSDSLLSPNSQITLVQLTENSQTENKITQPQVPKSLLSSKSNITQNKTSDISHIKNEIVKPQVSESMLSISDITQDQTQDDSQNEKEIVQPQVSDNLLLTDSDSTQDQITMNSETESVIVQPQVSNSLLNHTNEQTQDQTSGISQTENKDSQLHMYNNLLSSNREQIRHQTSGNISTEGGIVLPPAFNNSLPTSGDHEDQTTVINSRKEIDSVPTQTVIGVLSVLRDETKDLSLGGNLLENGSVLLQKTNSLLDTPSILSPSNTAENILAQNDNGQKHFFTTSSPRYEKFKNNETVGSHFRGNNVTIERLNSNVSSLKIEDQKYDTATENLSSKNHEVIQPLTSTITSLNAEKDMTIQLLNSSLVSEKKIWTDQPLTHNATYSYGGETDENRTGSAVTENLNIVRPQRFNTSSFSDENHNELITVNTNSEAGKDKTAQPLNSRATSFDNGTKIEHGILSNHSVNENGRPVQPDSKISSGEEESKDRNEITNDTNKTKIQEKEHEGGSLPLSYNIQYFPDTEFTRTQTTLNDSLKTEKEKNVQQNMIKKEVVTAGEQRTDTTTVQAQYSNYSKVIIQPMESIARFSHKEQDNNFEIKNKRMLRPFTNHTGDLINDEQSKDHTKLIKLFESEKKMNSKPIISIFKLPRKGNQNRENKKINKNETMVDSQLSKVIHSNKDVKTNDQTTANTQEVLAVEKERIEKSLNSSLRSSNGPHVHNLISENIQPLNESVKTVGSLFPNTTDSNNTEQRKDKTTKEGKSVATFENNVSPVTTDKKHSTERTQRNSLGSGNKNTVAMKNHSQFGQQSVTEIGTNISLTTTSSINSNTAEQSTKPMSQDAMKRFIVHELPPKSFNSDGVSSSHEVDIGKNEQYPKYNNSRIHQNIKVNNSLRNENTNSFIHDSPNLEAKFFKQSALHAANETKTRDNIVNADSQRNEVELLKNNKQLRNTSTLLTIQTPGNNLSVGYPQEKEEKGDKKYINTLLNNVSHSIVQEKSKKSYEQLSTNEPIQESLQEKINMEASSSTNSSRSNTTLDPNQKQRNSIYSLLQTNSTQVGSKKGKIHIVLTPLGTVPNMTVEIGVGTEDNLTQYFPNSLNTNFYKDTPAALNSSERDNNISQNTNQSNSYGRLSYRGIPKPKTLLQRSVGKGKTHTIKEYKDLEDKLALYEFHESIIRSYLNHSNDSKINDSNVLKTHGLKQNTNNEKNSTDKNSLSSNFDFNITDDSNKIIAQVNKIQNRKNLRKHSSLTSKETSTTDEDNIEDKNRSLNVKHKEEVTNRKRISKNEEVVEINEKIRKNKIIGKSKSVTKIKTEISSVDYE